MVFLFFLLIALLNLVVGVAMALAWQRYSLPAIGRPRGAAAARKPRPPGESPAEALPVEGAAEEIKEPPPVEECVPLAWLDTLSENAVEARSFVEATAQVLRLRILAYREQLVAIEDRVRRAKLKAAEIDWQAIVVELIQLNGEWLNVQSEAMGALIDRQEAPDDLAGIAHRLEDVLLEQTAQIETSRTMLEIAHESGVVEARTILAEVSRMLASAHRLRDLMHLSLAAILAVEQRFDKFDDRWQLDSLSGLANRAGLEILIHQWRGSEFISMGATSLLLFDIDGFAQTNGRFGTRLADRLLAEFSRVLQRGLRKDRGFDRLARYNGQQFLALLGGTSLVGAAHAAERLRQSAQAVEIVCGPSAISLRASCAVVELPPSEPLPDVLERLDRVLAAAKRQGGNCTFLDGGEGPEPVEHRPLSIPPMRLQVPDDDFVGEIELEAAMV